MKKLIFSLLFILTNLATNATQKVEYQNNLDENIKILREGEAPFIVYKKRLDVVNYPYTTAGSQRLYMIFEDTTTMKEDDLTGFDPTQGFGTNIKLTFNVNDYQISYLSSTNSLTSSNSTAGASTQKPLTPEQKQQQANTGSGGSSTNKTSATNTLDRTYSNSIPQKTYLTTNKSHQVFQLKPTVTTKVPLGKTNQNTTIEKSILSLGNPEFTYRRTTIAKKEKEKEFPILKLNNKNTQNKTNLKTKSKSTWEYWLCGILVTGLIVFLMNNKKKTDKK